MSFERVFSKGTLRMVFCVMCLAGLAGGSADAAPSACDRAAVLDLDSTSRLSIPSAEDLFVRVEVPAPGFLSLDVTAPGVSNAEPVLVPVSSSCDGRPSARPVILERTMASLVLGIDSPGNYVFRLTASDPAKTLSEIKVRTGHSTFGEDEDEIESEPNPFAGDGKPSSFGEDEDEIESEPNPFAGDGKPSSFGEDEDEIESEPNPFAGDSGKSASRSSLSTTAPLRPAGTTASSPGFQPGVAGRGTCALGERDDHGDTFGCATTVTPAVTAKGEIANDWGDDADVFRFVLPGSSSTDLWRVEVAVDGTLEPFGVLFDHHGERLGQVDSDGSGDGIRLTRVLRPGVYFLRLEGSLGAEGGYRLKLDVSAP